MMMSRWGNQRELDTYQKGKEGADGYGPEAADEGVGDESADQRSEICEAAPNTEDVWCWDLLQMKHCRQVHHEVGKQTKRCQSLKRFISCHNNNNNNLLNFKSYIIICI